MAINKLLYKHPEVDLRLKYRKIFEISLLAVLFFISCLFYAFKNFESEKVTLHFTGPDINVLDIPRTTIKNPPPPPPKPQMPVASEEEDFPDVLTINKTEIDFNQPLTAAPQPPPMDEDEPIVPFYETSEKPAVLQKVEPRYPDLARMAGIEGKVVVRVLIGTSGEVEDVKVIKSISLLDEAAIAAAREFKFRPGKQRDRFVKVWMVIPFQFHLKK